MTNTTFKQLEQKALESARKIGTDIPNLVEAYTAKYGSRDGANFAPPVGPQREIGYLHRQNKF